MIREMVHPNPPVVDGRAYDRLSVSLALSTDAPDQKHMLLRLVVTLTPYRMEQNRDDNGEFIDGWHVEMLHDAATVMVYPDSTRAAEGNPALAQFLVTLAAAGQQLINAVL